MGVPFEAVLDYDDEGFPPLEQWSGTFDPVVSVILRTTYHDYELDPARIKSLVIRRMEMQT